MAREKETYEDRIRGLYKRNGGRITPDMVIDDARDPSSPLHDKFDWNIESAAINSWRQTARALIRSVRVIVTIEDLPFRGVSKKIPEFVRDPSCRSDNQGFARIADIRTSKERSVAALMYEIERIEGALRRAIDVADGLGLTSEVVTVEQALEVLKNKARSVA